MATVIDITPEDWGQLRGPAAKLARAIENLEALEAGCETYLEAKPYVVTCDYETDVGCYVARLAIRKAPPLRLGAILGDVIHNLRSALDQVTWLLAGREKPFEELLKVRECIYFPITSSPKAFSDHRVMPYIGNDAKALLELLQPYQRDRPELHPLAYLNKLWNADKHRVVQAGAVGLNFSTLSFVPKALRIEDLRPVEVSYSITPETKLKNGTEVATVRFVGPEALETAKVDVKGQPTARIAFGSFGLAIYPATLWTAAEYVVTVCAGVRQAYFPDPA